MFILLQNTAVLSSAILITLVGMMLHIHFVKVEHESLLVIGSLGIQVSCSYASGRETTAFIEMNKIKDIAINEAIYMVRDAPSRNPFSVIRPVYVFMNWWDLCVLLVFQHQIIYYLCVLLKDPSDPNTVSGVLPLFQVRLTTSHKAAYISRRYFGILCLAMSKASLFLMNYLSIFFRVQNRGWTAWWRFIKTARRFFQSADETQPYGF